jgi:hypothetical protein
MADHGTTDLGKVMENVAAIAMHMGSCREKLDRANRQAGDQIDGCVGLYRAAVDMAVALEVYGRENKIFWGRDADWILTTETIAETLLIFIAEGKRIPYPDEREEIVRTSLTKS